MILKIYFYLLISAALFMNCGGEQKKPLKILRPQRSALSIMRTNDCFVCHSITDHVDIPSYEMIAERYSNDYKTIQTLKKKVLEGGGGNWGGALMVKHPFIKEHEAENIVKWILSLDSDSVLNDQKFYDSDLIMNKSKPYTLESYSINGEEINSSDTLFSGSLSTINVTKTEVMKSNSFIRITGDIEIERRGKYFFKLLKSGEGSMFRGKNIIISTRIDDNEIMLELEKGTMPFRIEYKVNTSEDTLALFWLPPGKEYYEMFQEIKSKSE